MQKFSKISIGDLSRQIKVPQKYMEFWEVNELLPSLEYYVHELQATKKVILSLMSVVEKGAKTLDGKVNLDPIQLNLQKKLKHHCSEYVAVIEKLAEFGAVVDDMDVMSFDFYSWLEGEEVFLCWQSGEKAVTYWHYPEETFSHRRMLDVADILYDDAECLLH